MKKFVKIASLVLAIVSLMAVAVPALAAVYSDRYSDVELYSNTPNGFSWQFEISKFAN